MKIKTFIIICLFIMLLLPLNGAAKDDNKKKDEISSKYTGKRGDFIFDDASLKNVLLFFARTYKFNIVLDPGISGKVNCRLINVPWDQAFELILRQHGLMYIKAKGVSEKPSMKIKKLPKK